MTPEPTKLAKAKIVNPVVQVASPCYDDIEISNRKRR